MFATIRAIHMGAVLLPFGALVFAFAIAAPAWRTSGTSDEWTRLSRWTRVVALWCLGASVVSALAWLALEAGRMSGLPLRDALSPATLHVVVGDTLFGRVWTVRLGVAIVLCFLLLADSRALRVERTGYDLSATTISALVLAGAYVATLALVGHAVGGDGAERYFRIVADGMHLIAAGAWLGALPGLAFALADAHRATDGAQIQRATLLTRRFSAIGVVAVCVLVLSGLVNTWYLVGDIPALVGTRYGRLLLAKLALFAAMATLAVVNRWRLAPRVAAHDRRALHVLSRNAVLEMIAGVAVVAIVGQLGVTVPAAHQPPVWPFDRTLSLQAVRDSPGVGLALAAAAACALVAGVYLWRMRRHGRPDTRMTIGLCAYIAIAAATGVLLLAVPAYPTTYLSSPVRYTTLAIADGAAHYAERCAGCHGPDGRGGGPAARALAIRPADLVAHATHHRVGDLFWWIAHGIPGTPMPGFAPVLSDAAIWNVVQFLRALSEADAASALTTQVERLRPLVAPDFTFEIGAGAQESLQQQRGHPTLLVLYALPGSLPRVRMLAAEESRFVAAGVRVIAVRAGDVTGAFAADSGVRAGPIYALAGADVGVAYAMFACPAGAECARPVHSEFLIDRAGYLRARWTGDAGAGDAWTNAILREVAVLEREPPHPPAPEEHMH